MLSFIACNRESYYSTHIIFSSLFCERDLNIHHRDLYSHSPYFAVANGGALADADDADYIFSDDADAEDTAPCVVCFPGVQAEIIEHVEAHVGLS